MVVSHDEPTISCANRRLKFIRHVLETVDVVRRMSTIPTEQVTLDALVSLDEATAGSRNL